MTNDLRHHIDLIENIQSPLVEDLPVGWHDRIKSGLKAAKFWNPVDQQQGHIELELSRAVNDWFLYFVKLMSYSQKTWTSVTWADLNFFFTRTPLQFSTQEMKTLISTAQKEYSIPNDFAGHQIVNQDPAYVKNLLGSLLKIAMSIYAQRNLRNMTSTSPAKLGPDDATQTNKPQPETPVERRRRLRRNLPARKYNTK